MKASNRQQLLIIVTLAVAALFVGDKLIYSPLSNWWDRRAQEIKKLRDDVREGSFYLRRGRALQDRWDQMRRNTLPNNSSQASEMVLKALQEWAQESDSSLNATTPQWRIDSEDYRTLVCSVDVSGSLWNLSRFLHDIEKGPMGLRIESLDLSSKDNTGQSLGLRMQLSGLLLTPHAK